MTMHVVVNPGVGYESEQITLQGDGTVEQFDTALISKTIGQVGGDGGSTVRAWRATCVASGAIRFLWDGSDPTQGALGLELAAGSVFTIEGYENVANFRVCDESGSGCSLDVMYEYL